MDQDQGFKCEDVILEDPTFVQGSRSHLRCNMKFGVIPM